MVRIKIIKAVHPFEEWKEYDVSPATAYRLEQAGNEIVVAVKEVKEKQNKSMENRKKKTKAL